MEETEQATAPRGSALGWGLGAGALALVLGLGLGLGGGAEALRGAPRLALAVGMGWGLAALLLVPGMWLLLHRARAEGRASQAACQAAQLHQRQQVEAAVTEQMESLGTLAAGLVHEMNNPLTYVLSNLRALSEELPELERALGARLPCQGWTPERLEELTACTREALEGVERIRGLIGGIRLYAQATREPLQPVNMNELVEGVLWLAQHQLRPRARVVKALGTVPLVQGNSKQLSQLVLHLLVNAAHAVDPTPQERREIEVRTWTEEGALRLEVRNTGRGLTPEELERILEPSSQVRRLGQGQGLWLCQGIARAHGGHLTVASTPEEGTRYRVHLPLLEQAAGEPRRADDPRGGLGGLGPVGRMGSHGA